MSIGFAHLTDVGRPGESVTVLMRRTNTPAALWTDETGAVSAPNPSVLDSDGDVLFFAEDGWYDVLVSGGRILVATTPQPGTYAPAASSPVDGTKFWAGDGTWKNPTLGTYAALVNAPASVSGGFMLFAAATTAVMQSGVTGDTVPRWQRDAAGKQQWGVGGASAPDVNWYRMAAGIIGTDNNAQVAGRVGIGTAPSSGAALRVNPVAGDAGLLVRQATTPTGNPINILNPSGSHIYTVDSAGRINTFATSSTYALFQVLADGDTQATWKLRGDGGMFVGPGGSTGHDLNRYRKVVNSIGQWATDQSERIGISLGVGVDADTDFTGNTGHMVRIQTVNGTTYGLMIRGAANQANSLVDLQWTDGTKLCNFVSGYLEGPGWRVYAGTAQATAPADALMWAQAINPPGIGGDELHRFRIYGDGRLKWGPGGLAGAGTDVDTTLARAGTNELQTLGAFIVGNAALATSATSGFLYLPTSAGAPTGAPNAHTGTVPVEVDTTNSKLMAYIGGAWKGVVLA